MELSQRRPPERVEARNAARLEDASKEVDRLGKVVLTHGEVDCSDCVACDHERDRRGVAYQIFDEGLVRREPPRYVSPMCRRWSDERRMTRFPFADFAQQFRVLILCARERL